MSKTIIISLATLAIVGADWTISNSNNAAWYSLSSSRNGQHVYASSGDTNLWSSSDYGRTWKDNTNTGSAFKGVHVSGNGDMAFAADNAATGHIYLSTSHGATWTASNSAVAAWLWVTSSSDGKIAFATHGNVVQKSIDFGVTWSAVYTGPSGASFLVITTSDDAKYVYTVDSSGSGYIYKSEDWGTTWTQTAQALSPANWVSITTSADGEWVYANAASSYIARSKNHGVSWEKALDTANTWVDISTSSSGKVVVATSSGGVSAGIWQSLDHGDVWHQYEGGLTSPGAASWDPVAVDGDGSYAYLAANGGDVYRRHHHMRL